MYNVYIFERVVGFPLVVTAVMAVERTAKRTAAESYIVDLT